MEAIFKRKSVRKFLDRAITDDQIKQIVKAAMAAPSAGGAQHWHFVVLRDKDLKSTIAKRYPNIAPLESAPVGVLICADTSLEVYPGFWMLDCAAATQNILLMATELGLGGVWCAVYPDEEKMKGIKELLKLPESVQPFSIVPVGYPAEKIEPEDRFSEERIHYDSW